MMLPSEEDEDVLLARLDVIKELRSKTLHLEKVKARILQDLKSIKTEDQHLMEYRSEVETLKRERQMHVESLRIIERDIALLESAVSGGQHERDKIQERASLLFQEYNPLKREIDLQRTQIGLDKLSEISTKDTFPLNQESLSPPHPGHPNHSGPMDGPSSFLPTSNCSRHSPEQSPSFVASNQRPNCPVARMRRQQPPPMKTCSTCQELIHRNAPVCPICKAKSTSRNTKKAKRTHDSPS